MMPTENLPLRGTGNPQPFIIQEDSTLLKGISYIPLAGIFISYFQESSLKDQIKTLNIRYHSENIPRLVKLITVKNQYKVINVVRELLTVILIVAGTAFGFLSISFASCAIRSGVLLLLAGIHVYLIGKNNQIINELQTTGFRPGIVVY